MDESRQRTFNRSSDSHGHAVLGPLIWIGILLGFWALIAEWRMLPELVNVATAALP